MILTHFKLERLARRIARGAIARRWLAATLLVFCVVSANALTPSVATSLDEIYRAMGSGDAARSQQLSADLMAQTDAADVRRAAVLQARLDVLKEYAKLGEPEGQVLRAAVQKYREKNSRAGSVAMRMKIFDALARKDAQAALDSALAAEPVGMHPVGALAEIHDAQAQAAAALNPGSNLTRESATLALKDWQKLRDIRARWHEVRMYAVIASAYSRAGNKSAALLQLELASAMAIKTFGADSQLRMVVDMPRAGVLSDLDRHREALSVREQVLQAARERYGEHSIESARSEAMVASSLQEIGDYTAAREQFAHAETMLTTLPDVPTHVRAVIAINYGNLLQEMSDETAALAHYRQALAIFESENNTHFRAIVLANIGNTEFRLSHYESAIADYEQALVLREEADGKDSPGSSYALEGLGDCALALKRFADAESYFRRGLLVHGRSLSGQLNFGLALALWGQGKIDGAFRQATLTAENQQALQATFVADFSERQSMAYRDLLVPATALVVSLAAKRGDADSIARAWHLVMVERGLLARAQAHRLAAARALNDPALAPVWGAWQSANSAVAQAWLQSDVSSERMAALRLQAENAERALWDKNDRHDHSALRAMAAPSIAELERALPADGLLIAFTEGVADNPGRILTAGNKSAPEDWYAFALAPNAPPQLTRISAISELSAQVRAWYEQLRDPHSDLAQLRRNGSALRLHLLDPFLALDTKRSLFVVPEGELFRLSFAALPGVTSGYLIESGTRVHTLVHESDLLLPASTGSPARILLAGAPDFPTGVASRIAGKRQLCLRASRQRFAAIPNAARELDSLQKLLSASGADLPIKLIEGAAATKENVFAALANANVVHLATHGFSLAENCADDLQTRGVSLASSLARDASTSKTDALSGLAFSGANGGEADSPIGVLSADELATLDLSHVDWIALSACDSGLGPIGRNEGVFGMRRALRLAGARTIVMSLWQVDDASTADLMNTLYRARFVQHRDVPTAMASAMLAVVAARRASGQSDHPYYWAAFIDEGSWR